MPLRALVVPLLLTVPVVIETLRRRPEGPEGIDVPGAVPGAAGVPSAPAAARPTLRAREIRPLRRGEPVPRRDIGAGWAGRDLAPGR